MLKKFLIGFLFLNIVVLCIATTHVKNSRLVRSANTTDVCVNIQEFCGIFSFVLNGTSYNHRDNVAQLVLLTNGFFGTYDEWKWLIDITLGILTLTAITFPIAPIIPAATKIMLGIFIHPNTRFLIKRLLYHVWYDMIPEKNETLKLVLLDHDVIVEKVDGTSFLESFLHLFSFSQIKQGY